MPEKNPNANGVKPPAGKKSARKAKKPEVCTDMSQLPDDLQELARKMLVEGGAFEDVVEMVAETGKFKIVQAAVERYFRTDPGLQSERIARQRQVAKELKDALGGDPESAQSELAFTVLLMGLSGLSRRHEMSRIKNAMRVLKDHTDERFKEAESQRKDKKLGMAEKESRVRVQSLETKLNVATLQLDRLKQSIERQGKDKTLGPEIIQQINEIYGIVTAPEPEEASSGNYDAEA